MASILSDEFQTPPDGEASGQSSPPLTPGIDENQQDGQQKLKGRKRILKGIQRITSSPSLVRLGRGRSASEGSRRFRTGASISCVSLTSNCWDDPSVYGDLSNRRFSPAVSSGCSGADDHHQPSRVVGTENTAQNQTSIPLPADLRPSSRAVMLDSTAEEDIFEDALPVRRMSVGRLRRDTFVHLPMEVRINILKYLSPKELFRCSVVSKSWNKMCFDGQLWACLDTSTYYQEIPRYALLKVILAAGPFLRNLSLRGCAQLLDIWRTEGDRVTNLCRNLVQLNIEDCLMDPVTTNCFFTRNPRLRHINMCGVSTANNSSMEAIAENCPMLESLNISWCTGIDTRGLSSVVKSCTQLKDLRVTRIVGWDDEGIMSDLFKSNSLERLVLADCASMTDASLKTLIQGINPEIDILTGRPVVPPRKLKHLNLSNCRLLTENGVKILAHNVPELEGLHVSFLSTLTDDCIASIINTTPKLRFIELEELGELTNFVITELARAPCCQTLEHLNISFCENIGDTGILPLLRKCPSLRSLDLDNTRISDLTLMEICSQMRKRGVGPELSKIGFRLAVFDCGNVTWAGVREVLSNNCSVPYMSYPSSGAPKPTRASPSPRYSDDGEEEDSGEGIAEEDDDSSSTISSGSSITTTTSDSDSGSSTPYLPALSSPIPQPTPRPNLYPKEIISLKCYYGWQKTVDEHTKRVLRGNLASAMRLERKWGDYMMANEETGGTTRRSRRRARDLEALYDLDEDQEYGYGPAGLAPLGGRRRRARSGGCLVM
ncbi:F-box domain protein [Trichophyton interdigitale]|uniref:Leucine-rich repeat-containing protein 2 n=1 Tax=Trichophyton interdigitale TaxID=101480 RepID=A0A9P4YM71_9EURO|nr:Leucine-rich repeat-containing protein 2 [Trichophyton interdigitale]KAF3899577.1 Leucine-rich repeat-containing protein 2 [Trichophyton interdigitale]KAG8209886.1 F-box domain protein [Trichophyton interdigitale]